MPNADTYTPALDESVWAEVEEFVTASVTDAASRTPYTERDLMQVVSRLAVWGREVDLPMDLDVLLSESAIEAFVRDGLPSYTVAGKANRRSQLRALRAAWGRTDAFKPEAMASSDPSAPYTGAEVRRLTKWAAAQPTDEYRVDALSILGLGLGAGLAAGEIADMRGNGIRVDKAGIRVTVEGPRTRTLQVRQEWEGPLLAHAARAKPHEFLIRPDRKASSRNFLSNLIDRSTGPEFRPQSQRMRATWIVHHLTIGTPMKVLINAAGVQSLEAFSRFMEFVPSVPEREARVLLRC